MKEWEALTQYDWLLWFAGLFILFEFFKWVVTGAEWLFTKFGIETKRTRERRKTRERLEATEQSVAEIKKTIGEVVEQFYSIKDEIVEELGKIHDKIDAQKETDRAILRDRIASGMRYFSQSKDDEGNVHISFSDYVNLDELFQQYFQKDGNGPFLKMYEDEFRKFIIDR